MKITLDDKAVPDRIWYYLLDFNDRDGWKTMNAEFDKHRLIDLLLEEITRLFEIATKKDLEELTSEDNKHTDHFICDICGGVDIHTIICPLSGRKKSE